MRKMAAYCRSLFGTLLQADFMPGEGMDHLPNTLPSPTKLQYKILIKNKKRKEDTGVDGWMDGLILRNSRPSLASSAVHNVPLIEDDLAPTEVVIDGEVEREDEEAMKRRRERTGEVVKEMSELVNYITPYHFKVGE